MDENNEIKIGAVAIIKTSDGKVLVQHDNGEAIGCDEQLLEKALLDFMYDNF